MNFFSQYALSIHSQPKVLRSEFQYLSRYDKHLKKINHIKEVQKYILHNNNAEKLLANFKKKYLSHK